MHNEKVKKIFADLSNHMEKLAKKYGIKVVARALLCGIPLTLLNEDYLGLGQFDNAFSQVILIKHLFVTALVLLAIYSFEVLAPKVAKLAAKGPSPELLKAQKLQLRLASTGFALGLIILLLTAIVLSL